MVMKGSMRTSLAMLMILMTYLRDLKSVPAAGTRRPNLHLIVSQRCFQTDLLSDASTQVAGNLLVISLAIHRTITVEAVENSFVMTTPVVRLSLSTLASLWSLTSILAFLCTKRALSVSRKPVLMLFKCSFNCGLNLMKRCCYR